MEAKDMCPLVVVYGYTSKKNEMRFIGRNGTIIITGETTKRIGNILKHCNGLRSLEEIRLLSEERDTDGYQNLIDLLLQNRVICDSRNLYQQFHIDSGNPLIYHHDLGPEEVTELNKTARKSIETSLSIDLNEWDSPLLTLIRSRKTIRNFQEGIIKKRLLSGLFDGMYRLENKRRSVPSAGALYPLKIHAVILKEIENIQRGCYQYDPEKHCLNRLEINLTRDELNQILNNNEISLKAIAILFISADFEKITLKYANLGYRFALMEAGHAMQNAYLFCTENNLAIVEYGGFREDILKDIFEMNNPSEGILMCMALGIPDKNSEINIFGNDFIDNAWVLRHKLLGEDKPVKSIWTGSLNYKGYRPPFNIATARYRSTSKNIPPQAEKRNLAFGMGSSFEEANLKALVEAYERFSSGIVRIDICAKERELPGQIFDICKISPLKNEQYERLYIKKRDPENKTEWVEGKRFNGTEKIYVPIDQVFYPLYAEDLGRGLNYLANSTGVAAHFDFQKACENALMELIERDAIAATWYSKRNVESVPNSLLSESLQKRVEQWEQRDRSVKVLDITTDSIPVIMVIIFGDKYPCLAAGASAHFDWITAANKAFNEAELMLISWIRTKKRINNIEHIRSPHEHGILYFSRDNLKYAEWLLKARDARTAPQNNHEDIMKNFNPVIIDITPSSFPVDLKVVRVLSEKLMPLTFGYGSEHYGHPRMNMLGLKWSWNFPSQPHFFA